MSIVFYKFFINLRRKVVSIVNRLSANWGRVEKAEMSDAHSINNISRTTWEAAYVNDELGITQEDVRIRLGEDDEDSIFEKVERWRSVIQSSGETHEVFVIKDEDEVVGFVKPRITAGDRRYIEAIYVSPDAQGSGYGAALLLAALEWHGADDAIYLNVVAYNQRAIDFYEKFGFEQTERIVEDRLAKARGVAELPLIEMVLPVQKEI